MYGPGADISGCGCAVVPSVPAIPLLRHDVLDGSTWAEMVWRVIAGVLPKLHA